MVEFNIIAGRLSIHDPDVPGFAILDADASVRYRDEEGKLRKVDFEWEGISSVQEALVDVHGVGRQLVLHRPVPPAGIELTYRINTYPQRPFILLQLAIRNTGKAPIFLMEFCLFQVDPKRKSVLAAEPHPGGLRFLKLGWHGWSYAGLRSTEDRNSQRLSDLVGGLSYTNPATPRPHASGMFWSEGWSILADAEGALVAGLVSTAHQFGQVYACTRPGAEALKLVTQLDGIRLDPGESCASEWGYVQLLHLPHPQPGKDYVEAVGRQMNARLPESPPPAMWTHWYHFYHAIDERLFVRNLDALDRHRSSYPCQVVELDDGYQSAWGDWTVTNAKFPHGLDGLAHEIKAKGFTPGLWLAPFTAQSNSHLVREHPGWLVRNVRNRPLNAGFVYNMFVRALDATNPAVLEYLSKLVDTLVHQWGYGMLKLDFLYTAALPGKRYNPKLTRAEALRLGLEAIRRAAGEEAYLLGCGCPFGPAIGIVDAMRIGPDTAPSWEPYLQWLPWVSPLIRNEPSMPALRNACRNTLNLSVLHRRWWWNDPDCLLLRHTDTRLTEPEVQSAVTLVGLSGGLLVSSDDLRSLDPERLGWLSLLVPNLGVRGMPVDGLEHEMPGLYHVEAESGGKTWRLVGLFNWADHPQDCALKVQELGFEAGITLDVFDFWSANYSRLVGSELVYERVPPHGCKLLRIGAAGNAPRIVGDTLHISQGLEVSSFRVVGKLISIETIDLGRQVGGELWLWLPNPPASAECNGETVEVVDNGQRIYALQLQFFSRGNISIYL